MTLLPQFCIAPACLAGLASCLHLCGPLPSLLAVGLLLFLDTLFLLRAMVHLATVVIIKSETFYWIAVEDGTLMLKKRWKSMP